KALIDAFETAKKKDIPVVVHCITSKGKGYALAETDTIGKWHNVEPFDLKTGKPLSEIPEDEIAYSELVASYLEKEMSENKDIVAITPAMAYEAKMNRLFSRFPDRCYDVGIAEDLAVDMAGGLSLSGKTPFVFIESSYLQRAYDQLNHDVARMNLPMVVAVDHSSLVPKEGETHHGVFDISLLRTLPNVVVCEGKDAKEIKDLLYTGLRSNKPFFIRYPIGNLKRSDDDERSGIAIGSWECINQIEDPEVYILSYGKAVNRMKRIIEENELPYSLINTRFIKPIDETILKEVLQHQKPIYLYTNDMIKGGLGDEILEFANRNHLPIQMEVIGIDDVYVGHGSASRLKESLKIDIRSLFEKIEKEKSR
ncbi:MAG: 1-deoxy-D-xylulose-5-phosphate synthase, partial [Erysipelotrichaceae bacterium]|nr:1-deoxy-D-xylulose-5-phosphate synthase [Erysipelotrichaceae bacterium]